MKIRYNLVDQVYSYTQEDNDEAKKINFVLSNNKGDFLNLGATQGLTKYQGLCVLDQFNLDVFKFLDEILIDGFNVSSIEYGGYYAQRNYTSKYTEGQSGDLSTYDRFYLGPKGGFVYEIFNYEGKLFVDLDLRKLNDFDEWGRDYKVYVRDGIIFVEYEKKKEGKTQYKLYFGLKAPNITYDFIKNFVQKEYSYSKKRNSLYQRYIYRLLSINLIDKKRIIFGAGFSEREVREQILFLEKNQNECENLEKELFREITLQKEFLKPISHDVNVAYRLSTNAVYKFLKKGLKVKHVKSGSYAGFLWFSNIWTRDELVGLRSFINFAEEEFVKEKLYDYLDLINYNLGTLKRIEIEGSIDSCDGVFWLAKRFEDFIFHLDENSRLNEVFNNKELKLIFKKFHLAFTKIVENFWDKDKELLKVKYGDSWMDTIETKYPLDIQVQLLSLVSFLVVLGTMVLRDKELSDLKEFEDLLKAKIRETYYRNECLYQEAFENRISCNVFLAYYFYPELFTISDWEKIFDSALLNLKTSWGGISSISSKDKEFQSNYTGENNLSYHRGDSWFWINNITAIALNDLNEKKYRNYISKILISSTKDILRHGSIGFGSEISSASSQRAEGNFAQMWSSSTYIEMIDKLFEKKN